MHLWLCQLLFVCLLFCSSGVGRVVNALYTGINVLTSFIHFSSSYTEKQSNWSHVKENYRWVPIDGPRQTEINGKHKHHTIGFTRFTWSLLTEYHRFGCRSCWIIQRDCETKMHYITNKWILWDYVPDILWYEFRMKKPNLLSDLSVVYESTSFPYFWKNNVRKRKMNGFGSFWK